MDFSLNNIQFYGEEKVFKILLEVVRIKTPETILRVCGGIVRDRLLDINNSYDIDIAVSNMSGLDFAKLVVEYLEEQDMAIRMPTVIKANPDQSKHLETAMLEIDGLSIDFVNLRKETYAESRIPTIEFGTIEEDAQRRDLTINALYYNLHTKQIEDYVGGLHDLEYSYAKTPIDPIQTFIDDPLRIYRCVRFATRYNLLVEDNIIWAAREFKVQEALQNKVSADRIFKEIGGYTLPNGEWKRGCFCINSYKALELFEKMDLLHILFEDCNIDFYKSFYYLREIGSIGSYEDQLVIALSVILRMNTESQIKESLLKIKCPLNIISRINKLLKAVRSLKLSNLSNIEIRKFLNLASDDYDFAANILAIDFNGNVDFEKDSGVWDKIYSFVKDHGHTIKSPIDGNDLIEDGFPKGKIIGQALGAIDELLLENPKLTKTEALEFCQQFKC